MNLEQKRSCKALIASIAVAIIFVTGAISKAEDGYRLWLRYDPLRDHGHDHRVIYSALPLTWHRWNLQG